MSGDRWMKIKQYAGTNSRDEGFVREGDEVHGPQVVGRYWMEFINFNIEASPKSTFPHKLFPAFFCVACCGTGITPQDPFARS